MSPAIAVPAHLPRPMDSLRFAAGTWLVAMLLAQWAFFYYIAAFYGSATLEGDFEAWNRLIAFGRRPYVPGDTAGNVTFASHAFGAGIVALTGALQLVPQIRARFPRFHRWNGRIFLVTVLTLSLSGFYLVWVRDASPTTLDSLGTSLNGVLIVGFAIAAWRAIRRRDLPRHRAWAMRLYLVANAQWFLRVGVFAYFVIARAVGHAPTFADPFFAFWKFGCFLLPLALLQGYLLASQRGTATVRRTTAFVLVLGTLLMLVGAAAFGVICQKIIAGAPLGL
jgi:uncharacterized membrane protein